MADVTAHGDATFDTQSVCQVGFEPGADNFLILVEQVLMPAQKLTIVQEKQSELVSAYWKGDYVATSMVLYTNGNTYTSTRAHGVDLNYEIVNGGVTYAAESLVAVEFVFSDVFTLAEVTSFELHSARTEWGESAILTVNSPDVLMPPVRAATGSMPLKSVMTRSQTGFIDFKISNTAEGVGLVAWTNGYELQFGSNRTVDLYGPLSLTTGPDSSVSRYVFTDGGNDAVGMISAEGLIRIQSHADVRSHVSGSVTLSTTWDTVEDDRGVALGEATATTWEDHWLIWRENGPRKTLESLKYYETSSSNSMSGIVELWGTNSITADLRPTQERGWTSVGYFEIGQLADDTRGAKVARQFQYVGAGTRTVDESYTTHIYQPHIGWHGDSEWVLMNDGTAASPVSTDAFGIWGITAVHLWTGSSSSARFGRISVNDDLDVSLADAETARLVGGLDSIVIPSSGTYKLLSGVTQTDSSSVYRLGWTYDSSNATFSLYLNESLEAHVSSNITMGSVVALGRRYTNRHNMSHATSAQGMFRNIYFFNAAKTSTQLSRSSPGSQAAVFGWTCFSALPEISGYIPKVGTGPGERWVLALDPSTFTMTTVVTSMKTAGGPVFMTWTNSMNLVSYTFSASVTVDGRAPTNVSCAVDGTTVTAHVYATYDGLQSGAAVVSGDIVVTLSGSRFGETYTFPPVTRSASTIVTLPAQVNTFITSASHNLPAGFRAVVGDPVEVVMNMHASGGSGGELWTDVPSQIVKNVTCTTDPSVPNQTVLWTNASPSGLTLDYAAQTVHLQYTATSKYTKTFFITILGPDGFERQMQVPSPIQGSEILEFPTVLQPVQMSPDVVATGQQVTITSTLSAFNEHISALDPVITPSVYASFTPTASTSTAAESTLYTYTFTVNYDVDHMGTFELRYGNVGRTYTWASNTVLTAGAHIYGIPQTMYFESGIILEKNLAMTLLLTLSDGDGLGDGLSGVSVTHVYVSLDGAASPGTDFIGTCTIDTAANTITVPNVTVTEFADIPITVEIQVGSVTANVVATIAMAQVDSGVIQPYPLFFMLGQTDAPKYHAWSGTYQHNGDPSDFDPASAKIYPLVDSCVHAAPISTRTPHLYSDFLTTNASYIGSVTLWDGNGRNALGYMSSILKDTLGTIGSTNKHTATPFFDIGEKTYVQTNGYAGWQHVASHMSGNMPGGHTGALGWTMYIGSNFHRVHGFMLDFSDTEVGYLEVCELEVMCRGTPSWSGREWQHGYAVIYALEDDGIIRAQDITIGSNRWNNGWATGHYNHGVVKGGNNYERAIQTRHYYGGGATYWSGYQGNSGSTSISNNQQNTGSWHWEWRRILKSNGYDDRTKVVAIVLGNLQLAGMIYNQTSENYRSEFGQYDLHPNTTNVQLQPHHSQAWYQDEAGNWHKVYGNGNWVALNTTNWQHIGGAPVSPVITADTYSFTSTVTTQITSGTSIAMTWFNPFKLSAYTFSASVSVGGRAPTVVGGVVNGKTVTVPLWATYDGLQASAHNNEDIVVTLSVFKSGTLEYALTPVTRAGNTIFVIPASVNSLVTNTVPSLGAFRALVGEEIELVMDMHLNNGSGGALWTDVEAQMVKQVSCTTDVAVPDQEILWTNAATYGLTVNLTAQTVHLQYTATSIATKTFFITILGPDAHERVIQVPSPILASEILTSPPPGWPVDGTGGWVWPKNNTDPPYWGALATDDPSYIGHYQSRHNWMMANYDPAVYHIQNVWNYQGHPDSWYHDITNWSWEHQNLYVYGTGVIGYSTDRIMTSPEGYQFTSFNNVDMNGYANWLSHYGHYSTSLGSGQCRINSSPNVNSSVYSHNPPPWYHCFGFLNAATVTRIWVGFSGSMEGASGTYRLTGYPSSADMGQNINGIVMLEITGNSWFDQWTDLTAPYTTSYLRFERTDTAVITGSLEHLWNTCIFGQGPILNPYPSINIEGNYHSWSAPAEQTGSYSAELNWQPASATYHLAMTACTLNATLDGDFEIIFGWKHDYHAYGLTWGPNVDHTKFGHIADWNAGYGDWPMANHTDMWLKNGIDMAAWRDNTLQGTLTSSHSSGFYWQKPASSGPIVVNGDQYSPNYANDYRISGNWGDIGSISHYTQIKRVGNTVYWRRSAYPQDPGTMWTSSNGTGNTYQAGSNGSAAGSYPGILKENLSLDTGDKVCVTLHAQTTTADTSGQHPAQILYSSGSAANIRFTNENEFDRDNWSIGGYTKKLGMDPWYEPLRYTLPGKYIPPCYVNSYFTLGASEMTFNDSDHFTGFSTSRGNIAITGSSLLTKGTRNTSNIMRFTYTSNDTSTASAFQVSTNTITNFTFKTYVQVYRIGPNTPSGAELFRPSPTMIGPRAANELSYNTGLYSQAIWNTYASYGVMYPLHTLYVYSERLNGAEKTSLTVSTGINDSNHLSSANATATGDQLFYIQFYQSNSDLNFNEYFPYPGLNHEELFIKNYIHTRQIVQDTEVYETAFFQTNITQAEREAYVEYISNKYNAPSLM